MRGWRRLPGSKPSRLPNSRPDALQPEGRATVVRCFDAWREAAYDVEAASRRWQGAPPDDWEASASGFFAALEREEKAAAEYERAWHAWRPPARVTAVGS
jgi:hypothetical protein